MERSVVPAVTLTLLLIGMLTLPFNIQLAEPSKSSVTEWNRTYGGLYHDRAYSLVETSDGGYALAGSTALSLAAAGDFWLVKVDSSGNHLWNKTYGGVWFDVARSIVETGDGGYALAGYTESFGAGEEDFWLIKTDSEGNMQWNRTYGGEIGDRAFSLAQTSDGGYALAGNTFSFGVGGDFWLVKTDSAGNMEWNKTYGGADYEVAASVVETDDGGYALVGTQESHDGADSWLVKTDAAGNMEWNKTYGGSNWEEANCVVETSDGGYALAGNTESFGAGGADFWLVKTDSSGNHLWNRTYGGARDDAALYAVETSDGGYALTGCTRSFGAGQGDFWLVKANSSGNVEGGRTNGGTKWDWAFCVVEATDGGYVSAGSTESFGAGGEDFWLVKVAEPTAEDMFGSLVLYIGLASTALIVAVVTAVYVTQKKRALKQKQSTKFAYIN